MNNNFAPACTLVEGRCMGCFYADECNYYNDVKPYDVPLVQLSPDASEPELIFDSYMMLCKGRHEIPEAIDGAIFDNTVNPLAINELEDIARKKLADVCGLHLYVTGLTVALVAVLNVCRDLDIRVKLYHFDRETGEYYTQEVR